jgi:hypothetical protein
MGVPHFLVHSLELAVAIQGANLALIQGDPEALKRLGQGGSVGHRFRELLEPGRYNPGPARLASARLPFKRSLRAQYWLKFRLAVAAGMPADSRRSFDPSCAKKERVVRKVTY